MIAGVAVIALVAGLVAWFNRPAAAPAPSPSSTAAGTAQDAVRGYLDALVTGKASDALAFALTPPADVRFLTDDALAASRKTEPWTVVRVEAVEGTGQVEVPVVLSFDGQERQVTIAAVSTDRGWRLPSVAGQVSLAGIAPELPLLLDGQQLGNEAVIAVFPGVHTVTDGLAEVDAGAKPVIVDAPEQTVSVILNPELTKEGKAVLQKLAVASMKKCLAQRSLSPEGCPNVAALEQGKPVTKSIRWSLQGDPWKKATYSVTATAPTTLVGITNMTFGLRTRVTAKGAEYSVDDKVSYLVRFSATVTGGTPTLTWQRTR